MTCSPGSTRTGSPTFAVCSSIVADAAPAPAPVTFTRTTGTRPASARIARPAVSATSVSPAASASASAWAYASYAVASLPTCSSACPNVNLTFGDDRIASTACSFSAASAHRPAFARSTASL